MFKELIQKILGFIAMRKMRKALKTTAGYTAKNNRTKLKFRHGVWTDEEDFMFWIDNYSGLPCMIIRNQSLGNLCGYVGVNKSHPFYGQSYDYVEKQTNNTAHGGLTFANRFKLQRFMRLLTAEMDSKDIHKIINYWWLGFDCAHAGDLIPGMPEEFAKISARQDTYKDFPFVIDECTALAAELSVFTKHEFLTKINRLMKEQLKLKGTIKCTKIT